MSAPRLALLGGQDEPEIAALRAELRRRHIDPLLIDTVALPAAGRMTFEFGRWRYEDARLSELRGLFIRRLFIHPLDPACAGPLESDPRATVAVLREKESLLRSMLTACAARGAAMINPPETLTCHFLKTETLRRLAETGLPVPDTLTTNDPGAVRTFAARHPEVIYKPLSGGAAARLLTEGDLRPERLDQLRRSPVLFQERVRGVDVRAYTLAGRLIAGGLLDCDAVDFRTTGRAFTSDPLLEGERQAAIQAARATGLTFAGIDLKRSPDGGCVLLDVNPAPMFAAFERSTGTDISGALAEHLAGLCG